MYNKAILIGRLTAEPELRQTQGGVHVVRFSIACDRRYLQDGERKTDFLNIVAWRSAADFICRYFHKGDAVGIDGSIQVRSYEDKNGNKRTATEIAAESVFFAGGRNNSGADTALKTGNAAADENEFFKGVTEGDLAFYGALKD